MGRQGLCCGKVDKIVSKLQVAATVYGVARGGCWDFDFGAFLPDSSLGL